jgi:hypothetical protein
MTRRLALLFPPIVVLGSAHELYLRNQHELGHTVAVLRPFWLAALAMVVLAAVIQHRAANSVPARGLLWGYYLGGVAALVWGLARGLDVADHLPHWVLDTAPGAFVFAWTWVAAALWLARRARPERIEAPIALAACAFTAQAAYLFCLRFEPAPMKSPPLSPAEAAVSEGRPNVYHVILDAFPDGFFDQSPEEIRRAFDGFVLFPATRPTSTATSDSVPSIMTGHERIAGRPAAMRDLLGTEALPSRLARAGYTTFGVLPRSVYAGYEAAFDRVLFHDENSRLEDAAAMHALFFRRLWWFRLAPLAVLEPLAGGKDVEFLRSARGQRISTYTQPLESRLSFAAFIDMESRLAAQSRYSVVHVLIPHNPYVLRGDCSVGSASNTTDLRQQAECALRLTSSFLQRLQELGRYDPSTIVVHGDHGSGTSLRGGQLVDDAAAAWRTMLLFKQPGAHGVVRVSDRKATLRDVAPTILSAVGVSAGGAEGGRSLISLPND